MYSRAEQQPTLGGILEEPLESEQLHEERLRRGRQGLARFSICRLHFRLYYHRLGNATVTACVATVILIWTVRIP